MEYLTLQDIPHRHCNPVLSHRMASQSTERSVGHMAAVCNIYSSPEPISTPHSTPPSFVLPLHQPLVCYGYASSIDSFERATALARRSSSSHELKEITLPETLQSPLSFPAPEKQFPGVGNFLCALEGDMDVRKHGYPISITRECTPESRERYIFWCNTKTTSQSHLQRSSPPLQPGEQSFPGKLPSFDEVSTTQLLRFHNAYPGSSSKQQSKGHRRIHPLEEMIPLRTPHTFARSSMM